MTTDYRALISKMADELDYYRIGKEGYDTSHPLAAEARAALAEPELNKSCAVDPRGH